MTSPLIFPLCDGSTLVLDGPVDAALIAKVSAANRDAMDDLVETITKAVEAGNERVRQDIAAHFGQYAAGYANGRG